jgi:hypothetical protein
MIVLAFDLGRWRVLLPWLERGYSLWRTMDAWGVRLRARGDRWALDMLLPRSNARPERESPPVCGVLALP